MNEKEIRRISKEKLERKMEYIPVYNDEKDWRIRGRNSNARGREVGWKYSRRRRGRPWTSKTKAQEWPKKKIKREAKRRTGWKKGGLEKITTLNRKLNKKRGWKNIAGAKRWALARDGERSAGRARGKNNTLDTLEIIMTREMIQ